MKLWLAWVGQYVVLQLVDAAYLASSVIAVDSWEAVVRPWGLDLSDGLQTAEVALNPTLWLRLLGTLIGFDYAIYSSTTLGTILRSLLVAMGVALLIYQGRSLARSISRYIPFLGG